LVLVCTENRPFGRALTLRPDFGSIAMPPTTTAPKPAPALPPFPALSDAERADVARLVGCPAFILTCSDIENLPHASLWEA
jgi:hypothetical protein